MSPDETAGEAPPAPPSWLETVDELLDATIEGRDEIECSFSEFAVDVPLEMGPETEHAHWRLDGTVRVRTEGVRATLAEWLRYWDERPDPGRRTGPSAPVTDGESGDGT